MDNMQKTAALIGELAKTMNVACEPLKVQWLRSPELQIASSFPPEICYRISFATDPTKPCNECDLIITILL
jgi:hypothetical protein